MSEEFDLDKEILLKDEYEKTFGKDSEEYKLQDEKINNYLSSLSKKSVGSEDSLSALDNIPAVDCSTPSSNGLEAVLDCKKLEIWIPLNYLNFEALGELEEGEKYLKTIVRNEEDCYTIDRKLKDMYSGGLRSAITSHFGTIRWPTIVKLNKQPYPVYEYLDGEITEMNPSKARKKDRVDFESSKFKAENRVKLAEDNKFFEQFLEIRSIVDVMSLAVDIFYKSKNVLKEYMRKEDYSKLFRKIRDLNMGLSSNKSNSKLSFIEVQTYFNLFNEVVSFNQFKKLFLDENKDYSKIIDYTKKRLEE